MEPQKLTAGYGWIWIKQGYALFIKAPLLWMVMLSICVVSALALSALPVVGEPLTSLLLPVLIVGLFSGSRTLHQGGELELAHLLSGFQKHMAHLVTLGGISLVAQLLILSLMKVMGGAALVDILMSSPPPQDPLLIQQAVADAGLAILLGFTLFSVLLMAMQFAPMLVFFNDIQPVAAMKLSLRAFVNNIAPMSVYGVTFMFLAIFATIPMMIGWVVLLPIMFTSLYASYCDIFPALKQPGSAEIEVLNQDV